MANNPNTENTQIKYASENTVSAIVDNIKTLYVKKDELTKANIGLDKVDNTADSEKNVNHATTADSATTAGSAATATTAGSATKATQDGNGNVISDTYETKTDADVKLAAAQKYTDDKTSDLPTKLFVTSAIADIEGKISLKANKSEIEGLSEAISSKADQSYVDDLVASVGDKAVVEFITWDTGDTWEEIYGNNSGENGDSGEVTS